MKMEEAGKHGGGSVEECERLNRMCGRLRAELNRREQALKVSPARGLVAVAAGSRQAWLCGLLFMQPRVAVAVAVSCTTVWIWYVPECTGWLLLIVAQTIAAQFSKLRFDSYLFSLA